MKSTKAQEELQKIKTMSFKDKIWYIWEYYKIPILAVIFLIFFLATLLPSVLNQKEPEFTCYIINNPIYDERTDTLKDGFSAYAGLDTAKKEWELDTTMVLNTDESTGIGYEFFIKITAVIASKGLDVIIGDEAVTNYYSSLSGYLDLEEALPAEILDLVNDRLYYAADEFGEEKAYAIDISDSAVLKNIGISQEPLYFSILGNTPHLDMSILYLKYLLNL